MINQIFTCFIVAVTFALSGCTDPAESNNGSTVDRVNFADARWTYGTVLSSQLIGMSVQIEASNLIVTCPTGYSPAPNFSGSVDITATTDYKITNISASNKTAWGMVIKPDNSIDFDAGLPFAPNNLTTVAFNISAIEAWCIPAPITNWIITTPT